MRIKSYFAGSVEEAIQQARREMGEEAMLITTRRSSPQMRRMGAYEVVFGLPGETSTEPSQALVPQSRDLSSELQMLRAQLDEIKSSLQVSGLRPPNAAPEAAQLCRELLAAELDPDLARAITQEAYDAWQAAPQRAPLSFDSLRALALEALHRRVECAQSFAPGAKPPHRIIIFAGPPGAGKTTTLTKIAIQKCLAAQLSVRLISVDPHRVASHEKLRTFAGILGAGFTAANTVREFLEAVDEFQNKHYLLVDTPGYGVRDTDAARELSACLSRLDRKETHLVLPASTKRADLCRAVQQFEEFQPDYLLFTKLDETESFGGILSAAAMAGKPISFFARGQTIPEDLEPANAGALIGRLLDRAPMHAITAA